MAMVGRRMFAPTHLKTRLAGISTVVYGIQVIVRARELAVRHLEVGLKSSNSSIANIYPVNE